MGRTLVDVLPLVEGPQVELIVETSEGIDEMSAQVRIDVLRQELGQAGTVGRPVCVVAHDPVGAGPALVHR